MGLRSWFGPSKEEIWRLLATEIGAKFVEGGFAKGDKVVTTHGPWTVTLDTYAVSTGNTTMIFTRMRAPYVNPDGFRFTIYRKTMFSGVGKALGMQDVEIGVDPFDEDFIIKGTDETKLRWLFADADLRRLISSQKDIHLSVRDDDGWFGGRFPQGVDELHFSVPGVIKDLERLKQLYDLFAVTLDQLCKIGSAYSNQPGVEVR